jgi:ribosomal protein L10
MISKIGAVILMSVVALFLATPTAAFAKSSNPTKTKSLLKKFKSLKPGAPFSQIQSYLVKLTVLDPTKANQYAKIAVKLNLTADQVKKLNNNSVKILKKSGLPASQVKKFTKQVDKTYDNAPAPTPTPYQAFLTGAMPALG